MPNSLLAGKQVVNLSRRKTKKINTTLRINYEDASKVEGLIGALREAAGKNAELAAGTSAEVFLTDFGPNAIEIAAAIQVDAAANDKQLRQDFLFRLSDVIAAKGVQFAPPVDA